VGRLCGGRALGPAAEGWDLPGVDLVIDSRVPLGAGLSTSAALECVVGLALAHLVGLHDTTRLRTTLAAPSSSRSLPWVSRWSGVADRWRSMLLERCCSDSRPPSERPPSPRLLDEPGLDLDRRRYRGPPGHRLHLLTRQVVVHRGRYRCRRRRLVADFSEGRWTLRCLHLGHTVPAAGNIALCIAFGVHSEIWGSTARHLLNLTGMGLAAGRLWRSSRRCGRACRRAARAVSGAGHTDPDPSPSGPAGAAFQALVTSAAP
jgi:GHMP kinases N terminal domain